MFRKNCVVYNSVFGHFKLAEPLSFIGALVTLLVSSHFLIVGYSSGAGAVEEVK